MKVFSHITKLLFIIGFISFSQAPANNDFANATLIEHTADWCSAEPAYTTINATGDGSKGSAWNNGPNYNVWFKFQATTTQVNVQLNVGGVSGSMRHPFLALWNATGAEISSAVYYSSTGSINVQSNNLTVGNWYYISVDNHVGTSYRGTFTLCVDNKVNNDFKEKATEVPHTADWCSGEAAYTTINATADGTKGSAWNNGPNYNVWFKFQATTTEVNAELSIAGNLGTLRHPFLALWDEGGTEIASAAYFSSTSAINVQSKNLTIGNWYYISVDNHVGSNYRGTFTLCVDNEVNNDFKHKAVVVPHTTDWCSDEAIYTTLNASADGVKGSAWNNGPNYNVWFKFQATTNEVNAMLNVGDTSGSMRYPFIALWDEGGTEISSAAYYNSTSTINVQSRTLTIGNWYYISVDNHVGTGYRGTFSLCVDDEVNNDFKERAIVLPHTADWCSEDAAYTTLNASPDGFKGSSWNNGPNYNVWFKFQATTTQVNALVKVGGTTGTMRYPYAALWDSGGNEISSATYYNSTSNLNVQSASLNIGDWYYISVDNHVSTGYKGTFSVCLDVKVDYDLYEGAIDVTSLINSCSADALYTTIGATADRNKGSNWNNNGPKNNRWFKFTAPESGKISVTVDIGGGKGSQTTTQIALWQSDGVTEVTSKMYAYNAEDVVMGAKGLTPGRTYYISIDSYNSGYYGTFTLCLQDQLDYDFYDGAIDVTSFINTCSPDAIYTTIGASPDGNKGSKWNNNGPKNNRWFKFTAPASGKISITVDIGGEKGSQTTTQLALWQADGETEVTSKLYAYNAEDVVMGAKGLTPGQTYYISVDSYNSSYDGTFTLCLQDQLDYDFYEGAIDITSFINSCSPDAIYTTIGASPDGNKGSNWNNNGPQNNRWFKFTAPATGEINITVDIGDTKGSQTTTQIALWQTDGATEIASKRYAFNAEDVILGATGLTPGTVYYISVDSYNSSYDGTFTICLKDKPDYDFYDGAIDVTSFINGCSPDAIYTTIGASPDRNKGVNWNNNGPVLNRWFKFTAPATGQIKVTVDVGGSKGTQRLTQAALWHADGITEINSNRYVSSDDDVILSGANLAPGTTYYISVDTYNSSYDGTFSLCLVDKVDYDLYEGAIDVTSLINTCSADAIYTTVGGTPDRNKGLAWSIGPVYNRWFKFTAPESGQISVTVDIGGTKGTQKNTQLALWEDGGIVEVNSVRYASATDDVTLSAVGLTPNATYYISVDAYTGYSGTFTLCLEHTYVDFNGSSYYVDFGNNHNFTGTFSLESWVFQKSNASNATIISKGDVKSGSNRGYHLSIKNGYPNLTWYNNSGVALLNITSPYQITNNIWHHIATTYSSGKASLYLDGLLVASANVSAPVSNAFSFMLGASYDSSTPTVPKNYFNGYIDEVRVWNVGLSETQIREMMNQEIVQNGTAVKGKVIPSNISSNLSWANLRGYYPMTNNTAQDHSMYKINGYSKNNKASIQFQTAPLPYVSTQCGNWESPEIWLNNTSQYIPNATLYGQEVNWNIVKVSTDITANRSIKTVGLIIDSGKTLTINGDNQVYNSKYLELNGTIDLMNDSQLVQTSTSDLVTSAEGKILRRQEGTSNVYRYNYWSSPIGAKAATSFIDNNTSTNNTNNSAFTLNMLKDETGTNMLFTSAYNQLGKISTYWIYTFKNGVTYWDWAAVKTNTALEPGVGYTQKGTGNTGLQQQYIFEGKPNNGTVVVKVTDKGGAGSVANVSKTEYLLGNPYPSALDVHKFIDDNKGVISGTLQLWQQWGGNSHNLNEYQGGYAQVSKLGTIRASQFSGIYGATTGSATGTLPPEKYFPVGQGFIVEVIASGDVVFKNSQRAFVKEDDVDGVSFSTATILKSSGKLSKSSSEEVSSTSTDIQKIRLEFNTVVGPATKREILLGFSDFTTDAYDYGYDSQNFEENNNDFNLDLDGKNMYMQAYGPISSDKVVPLNFKSSGSNTFEIKATEFTNFDESQAVYLKDNLTDTYFDLKQNTSYRFTSTIGKFNTRFEIVFQSKQESLSTQEELISEHLIYYHNDSKMLFGKKLNTDIDKISIVDMRGQIVQEFNNISEQTLTSGLRINSVATGAYVVWFKTQTGQVLTKKIIIN